MKGIILLLCFLSVSAFSVEIPKSTRSERVIERVMSKLEMELNAKGLIYGSPIFVRIFKETSELGDRGVVPD